MTPEKIASIRDETYHEIGKAQIALLKAAPNHALEAIALKRLRLLHASLVELDEEEAKELRKRHDRGWRLTAAARVKAGLDRA